jgi:hypothetical protein
VDEMISRSGMIAFGTKRKRLLVPGICMLAIVLPVVTVWMSAPNANDPVYEGRRLSSWLRKYPLSFYSTTCAVSAVVFYFCAVVLGL